MYETFSSFEPSGYLQNREPRYFYVSTPLQQHGHIDSSWRRQHCLMAPVQAEARAQTLELVATVESPFHSGSDEWFRRGRQENKTCHWKTDEGSISL